jgi:uncharacterized protein YjiS (DUF1127 family)
MSAYEHSSRAAPQRTGHRPRVTVGQFLLRAMQRWQRGRATAELHRLDDRQLDDIGITRNDIPRVVDGLFAPPKRGQTNPAAGAYA